MLRTEAFPRVCDIRIYGGIKSVVAPVEYADEYAAAPAKKELRQTTSLPILPDIVLIRDSNGEGSVGIRYIGGAVLSTIIAITSPRIIRARLARQAHIYVNVAAMAPASQFMHDGIIGAETCNEPANYYRCHSRAAQP